MTPKRWTSFAITTPMAFGWAVNEDYYGGGDILIMGTDADGKCYAYKGELAGFMQKELKNSKGSSSESQMLKFLETAKETACPSWLSKK